MEMSQQRSPATKYTLSKHGAVSESQDLLYITLRPDDISFCPLPEGPL